MLGSNRVFIALSLLATVAMGCGGESTQPTTSSTGDGGTTSSSGTGGSGGASSSGSGGDQGGALMCDNGEGTVLAVSELAFGEGNSGEWKKVGVNLDGLATVSSSKDVCKPNSGAATSTPYPDGEDGIDNSFGKNLLPVILSLYPNWVPDINDGILEGVFTSLLKLECLPPTGDVPVLTTKLFGATTLDFIPKFDGTDKWPIAPELLSDLSDPESSTVIFPKSSVKGDQFDSGKNNTFILTVPLKSGSATTSLKLTLHAARTTMTLAADRKSATDGVIAGVLDTEELVAEVKKIGLLLDLCDTDVFNDILTTVRQASDILVDGTQDPEQTCNGISLGLQFKMQEALIGDVAPPTPAGPACR